MKTVISMSSIPSRLPFIERTIEELKTHDLPIYLWIPRYFKRGNLQFDGKIPDFCKGINVEIVEDEGPITKLLPALRAGFERIITYDDDWLYPKSISDSLIKYSDKDSKRAYCGCGVSFFGFRYRDGRATTSVKEPLEVSLLEGGMGAIYLNSFFDESIFDEYKESPTNDDFAISAHLKRKGIRLMVVPSENPKRSGLNDRDALYVINMREGANDTYLKKPQFRVLITG